MQFENKKDSCDAQILTRIIFYSLVYECIRESQPWAGETTHEHEEGLGRKQIRQAQSRARGAEQRRQRVAFQYDYGSHPKVTRSKIDKVCEFCRAKKFRTEPPGKVKLDTLNLPPEPLLSYMSGRTSESKPFLQNIRRYNSCFQMISFGTRATVEQDGSFMPTFKVKCGRSITKSEHCFRLRMRLHSSYKYNGCFFKFGVEVGVELSGNNKSKPKNDTVNNINIKMQNTLPASATIYKSIDAVIVNEQAVL
jgi:hypothetical protein